MEYYQKKYKKRKIRKIKLILFLVLFSILGGFVYSAFVVSPVVLEATRQSVFSLSTSAVSDAIYDVLQEENISYDDLVEIQYDTTGKIKLITLKTVRLNLIARKFYQVAQVYLDNMGQKGIDVSLGTFTGLPFFNGVGPKVNLKLVSIGAMTSMFKSNFVSAGINQTNHSLFIYLNTSVSLILPTYSKTIDSVTEMLVAESVIVGDVPEFYFGNNSSMDFVPR